MESMHVASLKGSVASACIRPAMPASKTLLLGMPDVPGAEGRQARLRFEDHGNKQLAFRGAKQASSVHRTLPTRSNPSSRCCTTDLAVLLTHGMFASHRPSNGVMRPRLALGIEHVVGQGFHMLPATTQDRNAVVRLEGPASRAAEAGRDKQAGDKSEESSDSDEADASKLSMVVSLQVFANTRLLTSPSCQSPPTRCTSSSLSR